MVPAHGDQNCTQTLPGGWWGWGSRGGGHGGRVRGLGVVIKRVGRVKGWWGSRGDGGQEGG